MTYLPIATKQNYDILCVVVEGTRHFFLHLKITNLDTVYFCIYISSQLQCLDLQNAAITCSLQVKMFIEVLTRLWVSSLCL